MVSWCLCPHAPRQGFPRKPGLDLGCSPHIRAEAELDPNPLSPIPLFRVPPSAQTHSPSQSPSSHLAQLWNLTVQYKSNFEKSTVSVRLFNSDYNRAKGCTCTGFLLPTERLCIRVRCLLPELLLCKSSPRGSPDLCKPNPGQESFCLYYSAPCRGMKYPGHLKQEGGFKDSP